MKKNTISKENAIEMYKVFLPGMKSKKGKLPAFELNKEYYEPKAVICNSGFHGCEKINNCFNYYPFSVENIVCKVLMWGEFDEEKDKKCFQYMKIVESIAWEDCLKLANTGHSNTGHSNTGDSNTGHWNTGDWNTGNSNTGHRNTGNWNTGDWNTGHRNTGHRNTGDWNTGNWNTGHRNTGDWNTGNWNTGDRNTGNRNTGNRNTGDWNSCNNETGVFNSEEGKIRLFNKTSNWSMRDWLTSDACRLSARLTLTKWIEPNEMTEEQVENLGHRNGFTLALDYKQACAVWWNDLSGIEKNCFLSLPNFDAAIFFEITGIKL